MPSKDGAMDDKKKTTKDVVNKKQKQMMNQEEYLPEEEYDRYRDEKMMRGGDHRSKETRERSNTPTGKQPKGKTVMQKELEKKYGKGKSALDMVKADHKDEIMDVDKKKKKKKDTKEELDLTQVAEAFGGYIIEQDIPDPWYNDKPDSPEKKKKAAKDAKKDIQQSPTEKRMSPKTDEFGTSGEKFKEPVKSTQAKGFKPKAGSQKFKEFPGAGPVKTIKKGKKTRFASTPKVSTASKFTDPESTKDFLKDIGDEPLGSEGMKKDAKKIISQGKKAERVPGGVGKKTGSLRKGTLKFSGDKAYTKMRGQMKTAQMNYQQRIQQAFDVGSGAPRVTDSRGKPTPLPKAQPLPAGEGKPKGVPQKEAPRGTPEISRQKVVTSGEYRGYGRGRKDVLPPKTGETNVRSATSADPDAYKSALSGKDKSGKILSKDERKRLFKQSKTSTPPYSKTGRLKNVRNQLKKGASELSTRIVTKPGSAAKGLAGSLGRRTFGRALTKRGLKFIPGLGNIVSGAEAVTRAMRGDIGGAAMSALETVPGIGNVAAAANFARDIARTRRVVSAVKKSKTLSKIVKGARQTPMARSMIKTGRRASRQAKKNPLLTIGGGTAGTMAMQQMYKPKRPKFDAGVVGKRTAG